MHRLEGGEIKRSVQRGRTDAEHKGLVKPCACRSSGRWWQQVMIQVSVLSGTFPKPAGELIAQF